MRTVLSLFVVFLFFVTGCVSKSKYDEQKKESENLRARIEVMKEEYQTEIGAKNAEIENLKAELRSQKDVGRKKDAEISILKASIESDEKIINDLNNALAKLRAEIAEIQRTKEEERD